MLIEGVAEVGVGQRRFTLERCPAVQQRQVVVLQDAQGDVAAMQIQAGAQHVGDAIGEQMQLAEAVAPVALDVHQRFVVGVALDGLRHEAGEVDLHGYLRLLFL
ncbi:hypothetical protein D3C80_1822750 [compost metagenome]